MQGWFLDYLILMTSIRVAVIVNAFTVVATNFSHRPNHVSVETRPRELFPAFYNRQISNSNSGYS